MKHNEGFNEGKHPVRLYKEEILVFPGPRS